METWTLTYPVRPWTTNKERTWHFQTRAKAVKEWRQAFEQLARDAGVPRLRWMCIEATPILGTNAPQDTGNCYPAVKAAIDGICDAGVVPDDNPTYLHWILFYPCEIQKGVNGLRITIIGEPL